MRCFFGLMCVLALGVMGCSGTTGVMLCEGVECDDGNVCTSDGVCDPADGQCDYAPVENGTPCGDDAGSCQQGSCLMACTEQGIRDAVAAGGGPYTFDCGDGMRVVTEAEIVIDNDCILDGEGDLTLDGNAEHRVMSVVVGTTAELRGLTITGGIGGVTNRGTLTLTRCTVSNNNGQDFGGIFNHVSGTLLLSDCTVSGNSSRQRAGIATHGDLTLRNSTVSGNGAHGSEGDVVAGIYISGRSTTLVTLTNSTISGNGVTGDEFSADSLTPGIFVLGDSGTTLTLTNSTIANNIYVAGGPVVTSKGTLFAGGDCWAEEDNLAGYFGWVSNGYNIDTFASNHPCVDPRYGFNHATDRTVSEQDLKLGELANNGGPTQTHALGEGSVAIDVIPADECLDADGAPLTTDQRGEPRPAADGCDVGAFERQPDDQ